MIPLKSGSVIPYPYLTSRPLKVPPRPKSKEKEEEGTQSSIHSAFILMSLKDIVSLKVVCLMVWVGLCFHFLPRTDLRLRILYPTPDIAIDICLT